MNAAARLLRITLLIDALTFFTAAALNFGARIPLGFTTLRFPFRVIPAGVGEIVIGAALLLGAFTMRRSWAWIGFWLSVGGIAFGLVLTLRSRGAAFDVQMVMLALALLMLGFLIWTKDQSAALAQQEGLEGSNRRQPGSKGIAGLMIVAALTLIGASMIHFRLTAPLIVDPFAAAAIPEAVLGVIMGVGAIVLMSGWPGSWEVAVACAVLTVLLTLYGFFTTLPSGRVGDITYHTTLLLMLFSSVGLLLSPVGRRAQALA